MVKTSLKWGFLLGLAVVLATQILTWMGLGLTQWFNIIGFVLLVIFVALASRNHKALHNGKLTLKNALINVVVMILVGGLIFQLYMFIYTRYVDPEWVDRVAKTWTASMQESGVDPERIEKSIQTFRSSYETVSMFTITLFTYAIPQFVLGMLTSLAFIFDFRKKS